MDDEWGKVDFDFDFDFDFALIGRKEFALRILFFLVYSSSTFWRSAFAFSLPINKEIEVRR